jgi:putative peptidoglycan lipid II flippase
MAAGTIVARVTGFGRNAVIGAALGSAIGNAYTTAQYFPQMVYELVMGGVLTSVLVPLIVRARKNDADGGEAFTHRLLTLAVILLAGATACVVAAAPLLVRLMGGAGNRELITDLSYLMLPALFFYGLSALLQSVLNTRDHFAAPMWAPIVNNVVVIAMGATFFVMYTSTLGAGKQFTSADITTPMVLLLGLGTTFGLVAQCAALWPALRRVDFKWKWRFDFGQLHLGEIGRLAGWILCYVAFNQVAVVVAVKVANIAAGAHGEHPGPLTYNNIYAVTMMAHGIVAVSVITALMPRLSAAANDRRFGDLASGLSSGIRLSTMVLMPITVVYVALGGPLAVLMFNYGKYDLSAATATGIGVMIGGLVLIPFSLSQLQTFAFYALTDSKTVALLNIPVIVVRAGGFLLALYLLPAQNVVAGIMVANGVSYVVSVVLSTIFLRRRIGLLGMRAIVATWIKQALAGAVALAAAWGVMRFLPGVSDATKWVLLAELAGVGALILVIYVGAAYLLRVGEITELTRMLRAKLGR